MTTTVGIITNTEQSLLQLVNGYIEKQYNSEKTTLNIYGDIKTGSLSMTISGINVDTKNVLFPISYLYTINLFSGTTTIVHGYKLLPGSELNVLSGATLNLEKGGQIIVYDNTWNDEAGGGVGYYYPNGKGAAKLSVAGRVEVKSGGTLAGLITGTQNGTVILDSGCGLTITSKEGYGKRKLLFSFEFVQTATFTKSTTFNNNDGSTISGESGKTYTYNGSSWTVG